MRHAEIEKRQLQGFIVLGMHRAGTSALTRTLNILGMELPDKVLVADQNNQSGYWEPKSVVQLNERILKDLDRLWADPKPIKIGWQNGTRATDYVKEASQLITEEYSLTRNLLMKDPRISRTLPIWREALTDLGITPTCIIVYRHPLEVAQSLAKRNSITLEHGLKLWSTYLLEAEHATRLLPRTFINYHELLSDCKKTLSQALDSLDTDTPPLTNEKLTQIEAFLDHGQQHQRYNNSEPAYDTPAHEAAYRLFKLLAQQDSEERTTEIDQLRTQWRSEWSATSPGSASSHYTHELPEWHKAESIRLLKLGQINEAVKRADFCIKLEPNSAMAHYHLGNLILKTGNTSRTLACFDKAIQLGCDLPHYRYAAAKTLEKIGETQSAIKQLEENIRAFAEHSDSYKYITRLYIKTASYKLAAQAIENLIGLNSSDAEAWSLLSDIQWQTKQTNESIVSNKEAIKLSPTHKTYSKTLATRLQGLKRHKQAVIAYTSALSIDPDNLSIHLSMVESLNTLNRRSQAIVHAVKASTLDNTNHQLLHKTSVLAIQDGQYELAANSLQKAIELDQSNAHYHFALSRVYASSDKKLLAVDAIQAAIELKPQNSDYSRHLSSVLALTGNYKEAIAALNKSVLQTCESRELFDLSANSPQTLSVTSFAAETLVNKPQILKELLSVLAWHGAMYWGKEIDKQANNPDKTTKLLPSLSANYPPIEPIKTTLGTPPKISIMLPVYNVKSESWLRECLDSILLQDQGPEWAEIMIVDDASRNNVANRVANDYSPRVSYHRNMENLGILQNHNHCLNLSNGEFVHIIHQDDKLENGFYKALLSKLNDDKELVAAFSNTTIIDETNIAKNALPILRRKAGVIDNFLPLQILKQRILFPSIIVRRSAYEQCKGFSPSLSFAFDWEMWARLASNGKVWFEPQALAFYRDHSSSETNTLSTSNRLNDCINALAMMSQLLSDEEQYLIQIALHNLLQGAWWQCAFRSDTSAENIRVTIEILTTGWACESTKDTLLSEFHAMQE